MATWRYKIYLRVIKIYFTSEHGEQVKYFSTRLDDFILPSNHVIFFLLYKILTIHNNVFGDFQKISDHFSKIFQDLTEGQSNVSEHFPKISEVFLRFLKITEDWQRLPKKVRRCFDHTLTNLSAVTGTKMLSKLIFPHMWIKIISSHVGYHFYQFVTTQ